MDDLSLAWITALVTIVIHAANTLINYRRQRLEERKFDQNQKNRVS